MDALGVVMMSAGAFLVYAAVKGEHPWTMFQTIITNGATAGTNTPGLGQSSVGNHGATGSAAVGTIVQTPSGPVKVH